MARSHDPQVVRFARMADYLGFGILRATIIA
jgi:hypothetical protein